jgi:hypothetical protein
MNKIDCVSELRGEYNVKVVEENRAVYESGWCKNTILSGGLQNLYNKDISTLTGLLDLGKSSALPGSLGYSLNGVVTRADSSIFLNIPRSKHSIYSENVGASKNASRVFYSYFASSIATTEQNLTEFAIKSIDGSGAFARNVFNRVVKVQPNQYIVLEYRLKVNRQHSFTSSLPFKTSSGHTFTVPCSGVCFNIPYNEMYRPDNELVLLNDNTNLPTFNSNWPIAQNFAINNKTSSTFRPIEIGRSINNNTRTYSVSTVYHNVSARPYGLFNQINTFVLNRNSGVQFSNGLANGSFVGIRFKFPLALYNYANNFFDVNGITNEVIENTGYIYRAYATSTSRYNKFDIGINYTWREIS